MSEVFSIRVQNLSCGSCAARAQKVLNEVDGVEDAAVNLADESARFSVASAKALKSAFAALEKAGYPGALKEDEDAAARREEKEHDVVSLGRATLFAAVLAVPVFILEMGSHLFPAVHHAIHNSIGIETSWQLQSVLTAILLLGPGARFFRRGVPALLRGAPDMNSLVALGTGAAFAYSALVLAAPEVLPEQSRAVYFESACVIVVLILLGRWLEARAKTRTGAAIERLIGLRPDMVRVEVDGDWTEMPLESLKVGQSFMVRAGERVAADGEVIKGHSDVDQSMLTGEPMPVSKTVGDNVTGGTMNTDGTLICRAIATGGDSKLAKIIEMVETAQGARLPIQGLVDRITLWFVPAVLAVALITVVVWGVVGPEPRLPFMLVAGVSVLIIACPCAMGLATPTSIMIGTGRAAELGVLFRTGGALQHLQNATVVAFDKTGTLTSGHPALIDVTPVAGGNRDTALAVIAAVEMSSQHPAARAIVAGAEGLVVPKADSSEAHAGRGVSGVVDGATIHVGKHSWISGMGVNLEMFEDARAAAEALGQTVFFAAKDKAAFAMLTIADQVKPSAKPAIEALKARGIRVALISGDSHAAVSHLADELGIDEVVADVLPEGKIAALDSLRKEGDVIAFVGDGINDAPALAHVDVGVAVGTGTDVAMDAADVVLMAGEPMGVTVALEASRQTMANIRQNLTWAFGYNVALIPIAAGVLYPLFGVLLSPGLAAGAMGLSSLFVLANAFRLRKMSI
ncbi:MAG: heavy metal translocating P-type ATPase [Sulfitobacter sp.]